MWQSASTAQLRGSPPSLWCLLAAASTTTDASTATDASGPDTLPGADPTSTGDDDPSKTTGALHAARRKSDVRRILRPIFTATVA
jgi:hypothetical protein